MPDQLVAAADVRARLAVEHRLTVDQLARAFSVYPSLTGSITDAARAMHIVN